MNYTPPAGARPASGFVRLRGLGSLLAAMLFAVVGLTAHAQTKATGTISGQVKKAITGESLSSVRVSVEGTTLTTLTNDYGEYTIIDVPAGSATVKAVFNGETPVTATITVAAGAVTTQTFEVGKTTAGKVQKDGSVVLDQFVVAAERYKTAEQIAINEERNSVNLKNVVSADAFGHIADGNVGEFVKYLPGVETEYGDSDAFSGAGLGGVNPATASQVSIRGFGAADTQITIDGMPLSGISPAGMTRAVGLDMISINNTSRVEIVKVPTPDSSNEFGGGTVNLITRGAFEYSKPKTTVTINGTFNSEQTNVFKKTPGPANKETYKLLPGISVSTVVPVNKKFGFSLSATSANSFSPNRSISTSWKNTTTTYSRIPTNNPTPTTAVVNAAGNISDLAHPFLRQATIVDNPWNDFKQSGNLKLDWRPFSGLTTSAGYTLSQYTGINVSRRMQFTAEMPQDWGADYVIGRPFEAATTNPTVAQLDPGNKGAMTVTARDRYGFAQQGYVKLSYAKGPWTVDTSASMSRTYGEFQDLKNKHFAEINLTLANVGQVIMRGIEDGHPTSLTIFDKNKNPLDYTQLTSWTIDNASTLDVKTQKSFQKDAVDTYSANVRRDLDFIHADSFHLAVKAGATMNIKEQKKYGLGTGGKIRYVGPTLTPAGIVDTGYQQAPGLGFSNIQQWADVYKIYDIYAQHPEYFNPDFDLTYTVTNYRTTIQQTKTIKEKRPTWYAQLEGSFFNNRLQFVGGVRKTQSEVSGFLPYSDSKWNYIKNPDNTVYTDSVYINGIKFDGSTVTVAGGGTAARDVFLTDTALIARLKAAGAKYPDHVILGPAGANATTANNIEAAKLQFYTRAASTKTNNPITPSLSMSYKITDNLSFKPSWSRTTSMPNLDAGNSTNIAGTTAILGAYVINENIIPTGLTGGDGSIILANPSLKPKTTDAYNFTLAYYTKNGGSFTSTYYLSKTKNNWEQVTITKDSPDYFPILDSFSLDRTIYDNWTLQTTANGDEVNKQTGYELSARQNLGIFKDIRFLTGLGEIGSHFNVFANFSHKNQKPSLKTGVVQLNAISSNNWNGGINFSYSRLSLGVKMTYVNALYAKNGSSVTYQGTAYQVYNVTPEEYKFDADLDYQISKRYRVWLSGKNIFNSERKRNQYDISGITPEYARINSLARFGVQVTAGITGEF